MFAPFAILVWKPLIIYSFTVFTHEFWEEVESYWFAIAKDQRKLQLKTILVDVTDTKCSLFNYWIVLGKLHLWNCRRNNSRPFFSSYKELIQRKYETGCQIAARYNNSKMLEAKWKPFLHCNLLGTLVCNRKKEKTNCKSSVRIEL